MKNLAQLISFLFHPVLFLLLIPFVIVYRQTYSGFYALKWELFSAFFIFFGIIAFLFGKWRGYFSDYDITKREERGRFYGITILIGFTYLSIALAFKGILFPLSIVALGIVFGILVFIIINTRIKASIHVASATAFFLTIGSLYGKFAFLALFWIVPALAWSRVYLKRHTLMEVISGCLMGIGVTVTTFLVGKYLYTHSL